MFVSERPDLAEAGRALLYQFGVGLAFLGTVRADGGPSLHPFCPLLEGDGIYAFLTPSPKRHDLKRDGRYAMHSFPADADEDAFYLTGTARADPDEQLRDRLTVRFAAERPQLDAIDLDQHEVFEFLIERCLLTRTSVHGDASPRHEVWRAQGIGS